MSIWEYDNLLKPKIEKENQLSLSEGGTPCGNCDTLAKFLNVQQVYLKREDSNPTGSFKDRSLAFQLSAYKQNGIDKFIISSSGNAAISAIAYSQLFKCELHVFVSSLLIKDKLDRLLKQANIEDFDIDTLHSREKQEVTKDNVTLHFSRRAKSDAFKLEQETNFTNLRGSLDDLAIEGFKTISLELQRQAKDTDAIFIPCSSGTSSVGIYRGYNENSLKCPHIHIVQTVKTHPIASFFDKEFNKNDSSLATAIADRVAHRKEEIIKIINYTHGSGWVVNDDEIMSAKSLMKQHCNLEISFDAALALAGLIKALASGYNIKNPVLIISGR